MKKTILILIFLFNLISTSNAQNSFGYGLKIPTENQLKSIPYIPKFNLPVNIILPMEFDLSDKMPPIGNQGYQGSCTAFAVVYATKTYQEKKQQNWLLSENGNIRFDRICSPSYVFNKLKTTTGNYNCLEGMYFSEAFEILKSLGTPFLNDFPYTDQNCNNVPSNEHDKKAVVNKISSYRSVNYKNRNEMKYNLSIGNPVIIGLMPCDYFQPDGFKAYNNKIQYTYIPKGILNPDNYHAMVCVGYSDKTNTFKVMNSWGSDWGNNGFVDIPYEWFPVLVQEAYTIYDAYPPGRFVADNTMETNTEKTTSSSLSFSSWLKEGYYREYEGIRFGITNLDTKENCITVNFREILTDKLIKTVIYQMNVTQTFHYNDKRISFTFTDIGKAGKNPLTKAAFFEIIVDSSIDLDLKSKIDKINTLIDQKNQFDKILNQQKNLLKQE